MASGSIAPPTRQYKRNSTSQWEEQKPHIRKLYIDENKTLDEVVQMMELQHDFRARYLALPIPTEVLYQSVSDMLIKF
jgi:Clr5 domain